MAIPTTIESLSTTAASNGPSGSDDRSTADDGLRYAYAFIKQTVSLGSNIASATTITPPSTGAVFNITGTTTIAAIASTNSWDGRVVTLIFAGALQLTHSSNFALPGSANITTAANDVASFVQTASGAWRLLYYTVAADNKTFQGSLTVKGNTTLGDAGTDTVTTNGNVTMNTPSSGIALSVTGVSGADTCELVNAGNAIATIRSTAASGVEAVSQYKNSAQAWKVGLGTGVGDSGFYIRDATRAANVVAIGTAGNVTINAPSSGYGLNIPSGTPASAGAAGTAGDIAWDSSYIYVCTATNTWKRAALSTW